MQPLVGSQRSTSLAASTPKSAPTLKPSQGMKLEGGSMQDFDHVLENQLGCIWDPTGSSGGMEIDDEQKLLPLPGSTTGMGDLAVRDGGSTSLMAPSSMGLGGPNLVVGFGMAMGLVNGSSTPTSSMGPTSSGWGLGLVHLAL